MQARLTLSLSQKGSKKFLDFCGQRGSVPSVLSGSVCGRCKIGTPCKLLLEAEPMRFASSLAVEPSELINLSNLSRE